MRDLRDPTAIGRLLLDSPTFAFGETILERADRLGSYRLPVTVDDPPHVRYPRDRELIVETSYRLEDAAFGINDLKGATNEP